MTLRTLVLNSLNNFQSNCGIVTFLLFEDFTLPFFPFKKSLSGHMFAALRLFLPQPEVLQVLSSLPGLPQSPRRTMM